MSATTHRRLLVALLGCTLLLASGCNLPPLRFSSAPPKATLVSGPSPFADCKLGSGGLHYIGGEVETWLAVNPAALKQGKTELAGVWMADRWSNGGGSGLVAATSSDGGKRWTQTPLAFGGCSTDGLRNWDRVSDPWITFGQDGTAYASGLIIDGDHGSWAVAAATSADGGRTWGNYQVLQEAVTKGKYGLDKESITADPTQPGTAYAIWTWYDRQPTAEPSETIFAVTRDGGKSWSKPRSIFRAPKDVTPVGSVIQVDPRNGTLYNIFRWATSTGPGEHDVKSMIGIQRSQDGGETWTEAKGVIDVVENMVNTPNGGPEVRTGGPLPLTAIDGRTGRIYAVWGDARFRDNKQEDIALSYSDDQGDTWSQPVRVNPESSRGAFRGTVAVNARGQVAVSYYDFREREQSAAKWPAHLWLAVYSPTDAGIGTPKETHIAGPFDLAKAPIAPTPFLGDYLGLVAVNDAFTLFYVVTNDDKDNPTDVFSVTVKGGAR
jgi:hypothetical protein